MKLLKSILLWTTLIYGVTLISIYAITHNNPSNNIIPIKRASIELKE